jgi:hypothetical protein
MNSQTITDLMNADAQGVTNMIADWIKEGYEPFHSWSDPEKEGDQFHQI